MATPEGRPPTPAPSKSARRQGPAGAMHVKRDLRACYCLTTDKLRRQWRKTHGGADPSASDLKRMQEAAGVAIWETKHAGNPRVTVGEVVRRASEQRRGQIDLDKRKRKGGKAPTGDETERAKRLRDLEVDAKAFPRIRTEIEAERESLLSEVDRPMIQGPKVRKPKALEASNLGDAGPQYRGLGTINAIVEGVKQAIRRR